MILLKKRLGLKISEETYKFFEQQKEKTGETFSEILDKIVIQHQTKSSDFMEQLAEVIFNKLEPRLTQLRTIGNETNVITRTNKELLNYLLLADNYIKDFEVNGYDKDHLVTMKAYDKVRAQVNHQRLIALENKRAKMKNNKE